MIESPLIQEIVAEAKHESILRVLRARFGSVPPKITNAVRGTQDDQQIDALLDWAALCPDLQGFRTKLPRRR